MIMSARMIGETADWTLFIDPTKTSGADLFRVLTFQTDPGILLSLVADW